MKIYVLGNDFIEEDNLAIKIMESLKDCYEFKQINTFEQIEYDEPFVIIDVVKGLKKVTLFQSLAEFENKKSMTAHDLDTSFFLNLLSEIGNLEKIKIIGIPQSGNISKLKSNLVKLLEECSLD